MNEIEKNMACSDAIVAAISENYADNKFNSDKAVAIAIAEHGIDRVRNVLAGSIQAKEHDGRISMLNKVWAKSVEVKDFDRSRVADRCHTGLLDLFASKFRKQFDERKKSTPIKSRSEAR